MEEYKMKQKTLYRIATEKGHGMWYDENGNPDGAIFRLCPDAKAVSIPMGYKSIHSDFGKQWYSAGDSVEMMKYWFTRYDAERLFNGGFKLYKIQSTEYRILENEILFTMEGVTDMQEISIDEVWETTKDGWSIGRIINQEINKTKFWMRYDNTKRLIDISDIDDYVNNGWKLLNKNVNNGEMKDE